MVELCACGHANDHPQKQCRHPLEDATACQCQYGVRVDVATFRALVETQEMVASQAMVLTEIGMNIARLLAVAEKASGFKTRVVPDGKGRAKIEVMQDIVIAH